MTFKKLECSDVFGRIFRILEEFSEEFLKDFSEDF